MKRKFTALTVAMAASLMLAAPAMSQVVDYDDIGAACASGGDCEGLVAAAIAQIQQTSASQEALEEQLGLLAGALAVRSEGLPMVHRFAIARGLRLIAQTSADSVQTGSIIRLAQRLEGRTGPANLPVGQFGSASEA